MRLSYGVKRLAFDLSLQNDIVDVVFDAGLKPPTMSERVLELLGKLQKTVVPPHLVLIVLDWKYAFVTALLKDGLLIGIPLFVELPPLVLLLLVGGLYLFGPTHHPLEVVALFLLLVS